VLEQSAQGLDGAGPNNKEADVLRDLSGNVAVLFDEEGVVGRFEYQLDTAQRATVDLSADPELVAMDLPMWPLVGCFDHGLLGPWNRYRCAAEMDELHRSVQRPGPRAERKAPTGVDVDGTNAVGLTWGR